MRRRPWDVVRPSLEIDVEVSDVAMDVVGSEDPCLLALLFFSFIVADDELSDVDIDASIL
jgi:hypothetical protein